MTGNNFPRQSAIAAHPLSQERDESARVRWASRWTGLTEHGKDDFLAETSALLSSNVMLPKEKSQNNQDNARGKKLTTERTFRHRAFFRGRLSQGSNKKRRHDDASVIHHTHVWWTQCVAAQRGH